MKFTLEEIATLIDGVVEGDKLVVVNTIEKIEVANPGAITFFSNPKYELKWFLLSWIFIIALLLLFKYGLGMSVVLWI